MKFFLVLIISLVLLNACSPVRNHSVSHKSRSSKSTLSQVVDTVKIADKPKQRFSDTTLIMLPTITAERKVELNDDFDKLVYLFDAEKFSEACPKFKTYSETLSTSDSLYYEAKFFYSECLFQQNQINDGKAILIQIEKDKELTDIVRERVLVRLGQIYCIEGNEKKADSYFKTLRNEYPKSIYIPLANCNVVK